jgi:hypothetical protein
MLVLNFLYEFDLDLLDSLKYEGPLVTLVSFINEALTVRVLVLAKVVIEIILPHYV